MSEMQMELQVLYIELNTDDEQCGDGGWLAKIKSTEVYANSSRRIKSQRIEKAKPKNF